MGKSLKHVVVAEGIETQEQRVFAIVLPETGAEAANQVAQRICDSIANDGVEPLLSVSIGVAVYPRDGERIEALFRAADTAMYSMKARKHQLLEAT
jgi:diguanylate cyclase (GGDEF)-like protein